MMQAQAPLPMEFNLDKFPGRKQAGNIDIFARPVVQNEDGSISTVRSLSFGTDDGEVLVPTVSEDGRIMSDEEAIDNYYKTGRHLGVFDTPDNATAFAERLHQQQEQLYARPVATPQEVQY